MELSRRDFLKASGAGIGGVFLVGALNGGVALASPVKKIPLTKQGKETPTICPYDASGCGFIVMADENGKCINIEGDPDHPVNKGAACAKGASMRQLSADNPWRLTKPLYRAPGASDWEEKNWDWILDNIFIALYGNALVLQFLETFKEFPPRSAPASFTISSAVEKLKKYTETMSG